MIRVENIETWGFEHAIRGMRNPMNSWAKSDSVFDYDSTSGCDHQCGVCDIFCTGLCNHIGNNDLDLMKRLFKGGSEHRKYLRQIIVSMDITAPLYWWKEYDTYKVGVSANSCSTMHKIHAKEFTLDDFSHEHLLGGNIWDSDPKDEYFEHENTPTWTAQALLNHTVCMLNHFRKLFLETKDKTYWWQMIQLLPSSYNQRRTVQMNYEVAVRIIEQRKGHKLDEWNVFVDILKGLPYVKEIMGKDNEK